MLDYGYEKSDSMTELSLLPQLLDNIVRIRCNPFESWSILKPTFKWGYKNEQNQTGKLLQSALNIDDKNKEKTELRPLLSARDFFKKVVITKTRMKPWVDDNGIFHIGLYDFLLEKDCLR